MSGSSFHSPRPQRMSGITRQEQRSITHGDFWIPEAARRVYQRALTALNAAGVPYVIAGAYAIYVHTGIYRETKDLDVFVEPHAVVTTLQVLKAAGFRARLEQPHWLAKATWGRHFVDVIFGMGNGLAFVDQEWYAHSRPAILAATPVRVAPPEELLWHRLFIGERHRQDMADIVHLIVCVGSAMDWRRLLDRTGEHWPLLLAQLQMFGYVYPEYAGAVPDWVMPELLERARAEQARPRSGERVTRGTLISRFSFAIDVNEWGFRDARDALVRRAEAAPMVREIAASSVWDVRSPATQEYDVRTR
ncbi:MAG TPA: nucleotidyltransferase family protein [Gemmatimonadaceae bacterium]|nr:nucleotidyltransferase family protein [Gemmatimonadaceae bacterium]